MEPLPCFQGASSLHAHRHVLCLQLLSGPWRTVTWLVPTSDLPSRPLQMQMSALGHARVSSASRLCAPASPGTVPLRHPLCPCCVGVWAASVCTGLWPLRLWERVSCLPSRVLSLALQEGVLQQLPDLWVPCTAPHVGRWGWASPCPPPRPPWGAGPQSGSRGGATTPARAARGVAGAAGTAWAAPSCPPPAGPALGFRATSVASAPVLTKSWLSKPTGWHHGAGPSPSPQVGGAPTCRRAAPFGGFWGQLQPWCPS